MAAPSSAVVAPDLMAAFERGVTLLTATERAARTLRRSMTGRGTAATPPSVLSLESWLAARWHTLIVEGHETRLLLNRTQEHRLWQAVILEDRETPRQVLRSPDALAGLAAEAWRLLLLANGRSRLSECNASTDGKAFVRWAREFERRCQREHLLAPASLPAALAAALEDGLLKLPPAGVLLVDFDFLPPAHISLFDAARTGGYPVDRFQTGAPPESATLHPAADEAAELANCAAWIKNQLDRHPAARLGIVVPGLGERRPVIERAFARAMPPQSGVAVEFSLGTPILHTGFVAAALDLLRWQLAPLPLGSISALLLSPFFAGSSPEALAAAEFDAFELRGTSLLRPELSLDATISLIEASSRRPQLAKLLDRLKMLRGVGYEAGLAPTQRQTHAEWAELFRAALEATGIPSAAAADSPGFQLLGRWVSTLDELATLDFDGTRPTAAEALATLTRIARETIFAPEAGDAAVQVLGPLEVGGMGFDALWFLGADDLAWPPSPAANPLLPRHLQRELGLRAADRSQDRALAQTLTQRIACAAQHVVFSFAERHDEGHRRPSPLLDALPWPTPAPTPHVPQPLLEVVDDLPIPHLPPVHVGGGARVLELQSACGFRAFAEMRLWSTGLESRSPGLDARERGTLVHSAMERFWRGAQGQDTLRAMPREERDRRLDQAIAEAIARSNGLVETAWDDAYLAVQQQRLRDLLQPWLDFEQTRPPFVIYRQETTLAPARIGRLTLKSLRVDRIDETEGGLLVLDYKTGLAAPAAWLSDRPEQPQLPLYAALLANSPEEPLAGVAFALLRAGDGMAMRGISDDPRVLPGSAKMDEPTFAEQVAEWQRVLGLLAEAFLTGDARVNPRSYPKTCTHCGQRILCRLDPTRLANEEETGEEEQHG
jgi:probable DNA repair protein